MLREYERKIKELERELMAEKEKLEVQLIEYGVEKILLSKRIVSLRKTLFLFFLQAYK